jgi:four helix bundle protein
VTGINSYRDLLVWQQAMDLAVSVYSASRSWPKDELYGLTSQARRASVSIAANIAEGYGRESRGAYIQFLCVAQGSIKELETHILLAHRVDILDRDNAAVLMENCESVGKLLRLLIRKLEANRD